MNNILVKGNLTILFTDSYNKWGGKITLYSDKVEADRIYEGDTELDVEEIDGDIVVTGGISYKRKEV